MLEFKRNSITPGYALVEAVRGINSSTSICNCDCNGKSTANKPSQGLIKSSSRPEQQEGVRLLSDIYRNAPERRRECLYYLALGHFKLGNYAEARRYNDSLLNIEPGNLQAASLRSLIEDKVQREGLVGVAIVGGVAIAAGVLGSFLFQNARRR